jgi:hypothetical protein
MVLRANAAIKAVVATRSQTAAHALQGGSYVFPSVSGQVTMATHFGQEMYRLASLPDTRLVLELVGLKHQKPLMSSPSSASHFRLLVTPSTGDVERGRVVPVYRGGP